MSTLCWGAPGRRASCVPVAPFSLVSGREDRGPVLPAPSWTGSWNQRRRAAVCSCLFSCLCFFLCISELLFLPETPARSPAKADMDAFLRPSVFKCVLVQVMAVLPLEQKPVCYPQGTAPALPPTPRPEGRGRLQLHTSQAQAAHQRPI